MMALKMVVAIRLMIEKKISPANLFSPKRFTSEYLLFVFSAKKDILFRDTAIFLDGKRSITVTDKNADNIHSKSFELSGYLIDIFAKNTQIIHFFDDCSLLFWKVL